MVNQKRLTDEFLELLHIDSISLQERKMADRLIEKLGSLGADIYEDSTGEKLGGDTGNLIANIKGTINAPVVLLSAHMDTVLPGKNKKPELRDGVFYSDGTTVLGGDNVAGLVIILETLRVLKELNIPHGDIQVAFSVAEELGVSGAGHMELDKIRAEYAVVLDCAGKPGTIALKAPAHYDIDVTIKGKAAHAGIEPERGISAVKIAGEAISKIPIGRIDDITTANIGIIRGGNARNIICDSVELKGEARSLDDVRARNQIERMRECFVSAAEIYGGEVYFDSYIKYPVLKVDKDSKIVQIIKKSAKGCCLDLEFISTGGGSDANILNSKGIQTVNIAIGMENMHRLDERIALADMVKSVEFLATIIKHTTY